MTINLGTIRIAPKESGYIPQDITAPQYRVPAGALVTNSQGITTAQNPSSGIWGNIWDIVTKGAGEILKTGSNLLLQKAQEKFSPPVNSTTGYPPFARSAQSPDIVANPAQNPISKYATDLFLEDSSLINFVKPVIQPAVSEGIKEGIISVAQKPPAWALIMIALIGVVVISQSLRS